MKAIELSNRASGKLIALAPLGFLFALMLGHGGQLASLPLAVGGLCGLLGYALRGLGRTSQEAMS